MEIKLQEITIRDLCRGYLDKHEDGVVGYGGLLDIRPAYQREFVYKDKQREEVIKTVRNNFPLNVMYWVKRPTLDAEGREQFEVLDGQQRTISICQYVQGVFSVDDRYFENLTSDEQAQILDYRLMVYICEGSDSEKLAWFRTINIAGVQLTEQELRNAVYAGSWLSDAKRHFSRIGCAGSKRGGDYAKGEVIRQGLLEEAIKWIAERDKSHVMSIEQYMAKHQHDKNAQELWLYFSQVINWIETIFPKARKQTKGLDWGIFYRDHHTRSDLDAKTLEEEIQRLLKDDEVQKKNGIYAYLLYREEKYLNLRAFSPSQKETQYALQEGICPHCEQHYEIDAMEGDHITPWSEGGKTSSDNLQMLCRDCNRRKGAK